MPETVPYVIIHIQVDTYDFSVIPKLELGKRYYFVFWWLYSFPSLPPSIDAKILSFFFFFFHIFKAFL